MIDSAVPLNENLINMPERNTLYIEKEMTKFMADHEGEMIVSDIMLLEDMGYEKKMINKVYILLQPENMERAIDYMTEIDGIYQHDFFESNNNSKDKNVCFICKRPRRYHINYVENSLLEDNDDKNLLEEDDLLIDNKKERNSISLKIDGVEINNTCNVCYEDIEKEDIKFNYLPCGHICCTQCWTNYLKTLITEAKVETIKCVEYKCKEEISEDFILRHIENDKKLVEKYNRFKKRASIFKDPNKKQCPEPDCESFLQKNQNQKYVKCENGHEFCFVCLRKPHGLTSCDEFMENEFLTWKKSKRVKRCPRCKIFTEKNEGCNHMTCTSCKYQWCWLCEGVYTYGHYDSGKCKGFQFTKADNLEEARNIDGNGDYNDDEDNLLDDDYIPPIPNRNLINNNNRNNVRRNIFRPRNNEYNSFCLHKIFPNFFKKPNIYNVHSCSKQYLYIFSMWIIGFLGFTYYTLFDSPCFFRVNKTCMLFSLVIAIGIPLFICYQILFTGLITPFILISLFYPKFINKIFKFLCMDVA